MERVYLETHVVNDIVKNQLLDVTSWLRSRTPLLSEVVLFELSCTPDRKLRCRFLELVQKLLQQPSLLVAVRGDGVVPVIKGIPILASPWELFKREIEGFISHSSKLSLAPDYPDWKDYITHPEKVDDQTANGLKKRKFQEEKEWQRIHKKALKKVQQHDLREDEFLHIATSPEGRKHFFEALFGETVKMYGCPAEKTSGLFEASPFCRATYYGFVYWIDWCAVNKGKSKENGAPKLDVWDVIQVGYLAYSEVAVCGSDLHELFSWVAQEAGIPCRVTLLQDLVRRWNDS